MPINPPVDGFFFSIINNLPSPSSRIIRAFPAWMKGGLES